MTVEPLFDLIRDSRILRGPTRTRFAALVIAIAIAVIAPQICRPILRS